MLMGASVPDQEPDNLIVTRTGRVLEVREYGDRAGHPAIFFHGLIGSHHQASYIADQATQHELRIIAPNRPGVGKSEFVERKSALEAVPDIEDLTAALQIDQFSVMGISGGAPYALACLYKLSPRIRTVTVISGMGPMRLSGALQGMDRQRRLALEIGSRYPNLAKQESRRWGERFRAHPTAFLNRLVSTWPAADQELFRRTEIFDLFLRDLRQVFIDGNGPQTFAQELRLYRNYGFSPADLPADRYVTLWQGLDDIIVPPAMTWKLAQTLPRCEAHFVPGGHFVAITISDQIIARLKQHLDDASDTVRTKDSSTR
jgi:pimeloyl-ACP methyl ester carboxylesterase